MLKLRPYKECDAEYISRLSRVGRTYKLFYFMRKLEVH